MQPMVLYASSGGFAFLIWLGFVIFSIASSISKKKKARQEMEQKRFGNQMQGTRQDVSYDPDRGTFDRRYQEQWDQQKIWEQTEKFAEDSHMSEQDYQGEQEFQRQKYMFQQQVPQEYVHEYVEEYVPEEFGEAQADASKDRFYTSAEIKNALQDEQDLARERAYRQKGKDAFKQEKLLRRKKKLFDGRNSLKKAILLSEVLGTPKSLQ